MKKFLLIAVLITAPFAKAEAPYAVHLDCSTNEESPIANRLCTAVSQEIARNSHRYYEVGSGGKTHWTISMVSLNVSDEKGAIATGITLSVTYPDTLDTLIDSYVFITGSNRVKEQAESILAAVDKDVRKVEDVYQHVKPEAGEQQ